MQRVWLRLWTVQQMWDGHVTCLHDELLSSPPTCLPLSCVWLLCCWLLCLLPLLPLPLWLRLLIAILLLRNRLLALPLLLRACRLSAPMCPLLLPFGFAPPWQQLAEPRLLLLPWQQWHHVLSCL